MTGITVIALPAAVVKEGATVAPLIVLQTIGSHGYDVELTPVPPLTMKSQLTYAAVIVAAELWVESIFLKAPAVSPERPKIVASLTYPPAKRVAAMSPAVAPPPLLSG